MAPGCGSLEVALGKGRLSSLKFLRMLWEDLRGGGLGGVGASFLACLISFLIFLSPSRTVELDDDEFKDSRTAAKP